MAPAADDGSATGAAVAMPAPEDVPVADYAVLKARFKLVQTRALALADEYERACEELRDEQDRQAIMVAKLAEIRVRRMTMYLRVPENGMMLFLEESKPQMRSRHPMASRREIQRLLLAEWESMPDDEQQVWTTRLRALVLKHRKKDDGNGKKTATSSSARRATKPSPSIAVASVASPASSTSTVVARTPKASTPLAKRKSASISNVGKEAGEEHAKKKLKVQPSGKESSAHKSDVSAKPSATKPAVKAKPKPPAPAKAQPVAGESTTPRPKGTSRTKQVKPDSKVVDTTALEQSGEVATPTKRSKKIPPRSDEETGGSPVKPSSTPRKSPAKPKKAATPKEKKTPTPKKAAAPKKKASPKGSAKPKPKLKQIYMKTFTSDDEDNATADDDDVDDEDDDEEDIAKDRRRGQKSGRDSRDDDSQSSGAGSGSDEDDDEHMAQLPTGAFG